MINRERPRLALLHYAAPPTIGGVESTIATHARLFTDHDYPVKIIAGRGDQFDARVPVQIIPAVDSTHPYVTEVTHELAMGIISSNFCSLTATVRDCLESALADVDVCIAHNVLTLHKNLALTNALHEIVQTQRVSLIGWCHDFAWSDPVYEKEMHTGAPWDLLRKAWIGVKYVVISEARRKELAHLLEISEADIAVVPVGIDTCEFLGVTQTTAQWVSEMNLLGAMPLFLMPIRVTRRKNIELAIEIIAALRNRGYMPRLIVMGPLGPHNPANTSYLDELYRLRHERGVDDAITFLLEYGFVNDEVRRDLYLLADALLFTSVREGFGIPILEAGVTRLPVFCSDIPPFRESAGKWAHYFSLDESPAVISDRITRFFAQDARYQLKRRLLRKYTWERIFAETIKPLVEMGQR